MKKRMMALIVAVIMMVLLLPINAFASGDPISAIHIDDITINGWEYEIATYYGDDISTAFIEYDTDEIFSDYVYDNIQFDFNQGYSETDVYQTNQGYNEFFFR